MSVRPYSLRARYILFTILLSTLIFIVLLWASLSVRQSSDTTLENAANRRLVQTTSSQIRDGVWEIDFHTNVYLLTPSEQNRQQLTASLNTLKQNIQMLADNPWSGTPSRKKLVGQLRDGMQSMRSIIGSLIEIRENQEMRFPSLSIIQGKLYPANLEFITLSSLALEEMPIEHMSSNDAEFYRLLADTQRIWQRMIASFRLFVAYRTETIINPRQGMTNEVNDINTLFAGVMNNLLQLQNLQRTDLPGIQGNETIEEMIYIAENWHENFKVVSEIHTSGQWRRDDAIIKNKLQPLSRQIRLRLHDLDHEIDQSVNIDMQSLTLLAESIIHRIWLLGGIILLFLLGGYVYLRKRVLEPISGVADGLLYRGSHNERHPLPYSDSREVNALVVAFNNLSESLEQAQAVVRHTDKMSVVGQLASGVAHEINNPLNNMARLTEFIEDEVVARNDNERVQEDFRILHHELDRCAAIVKNLLDFGKPSTPQMKQVNLADIIEESIKLLNHQALAKNISIRTEFSDTDHSVTADPSQIHQVIVNLLLNAIYFSPDGEDIAVSASAQNNGMICRIIDNGPGATEAEIEQFFEPFYTTRSGHEGTGLGLSVSYGIIQHHGGDIGAYSNESGGLTVWFTLPAEEKMNALLFFVDDDPVANQLFQRTCDKLQYDCRVFDSADQCLERIRQEVPGIVLTDLNMPGMDGFQLIETINSEWPQLPVIAITGQSSVERAVKAMRAGASDFVKKPYEIEELKSTIQRNLQYAGLSASGSMEKTRDSVVDYGMIGDSAEMHRIYRMIDKLSVVDCPVVISGESGSGKELAARAIHNTGPRRDEPFIAIDCGSLPDALLESELFGHVKGAFTDATDNRTGLLVAAAGGTVFLDEIGNISASMQTKLLRVMQEHTVTPVGSNQPEHIHARFICASNRDLSGMVDAGEFRHDLYHRINVVTLPMPGLSQRREDIPLLINRFIQEFSEKYTVPARHFSAEQQDKLCRLNWKGNIRELKNYVERCIILAEGETLDDISLPENTPVATGQSCGEFISLAELEKRHIKQVLKSVDGNQNKAATILGISRTTLWRKINEYD